MPISQNALFEGKPPVDMELEHPPGAYIAREIRAALLMTDWSPAEIDNWRDCGWSIDCANSTLQIALAQHDEAKWMLQISPSYIPGLFGRLLRKSASATPGRTLDLAQAVHGILSADEMFSGFQWCWDGYPDDESASNEPVAL